MLNPVEIREVISVWVVDSFAGPDADLQAFDVFPFQTLQFVVLAGVAT